VATTRLEPIGSEAAPGPEAVPGSEAAPANALRRLLRAATAGPTYEADERDRRDVRIAGLDLPLRALVALFLATAAIVLDSTQRIVAPVVSSVLGGADPTLNLSVERAITFSGLPLLAILIAFRDRPARYGLTLGEWRWGLGLLVAGLAVMTPIIAALATVPQFVAYYHGVRGSLGEVLLRNALEVVPAEFLLRGFLMFALWRRIGPIAIVVVQVPFVLTHLAKPEIELWSTFLGGSIFAWLDWRTRSILWSGIGHVYVLTLMVVLARGFVG
jgi:membrane protease YdiL (CAAX protease family)